ncbi:rRNA methyltransferase 3, mitochondrial [Anabrus simplex]|uniref:rRNA methyltransferase 3, mitochondrial n=1 Tax=Anabrus simplex TaxID=316456 RepID=UPI0035A2BF9F
MANYLKILKTLQGLVLVNSGRKGSVLVTNSRSYCRWAHRKPSRVIYPEHEENISPDKVKRLVEFEYRTETPVVSSLKELNSKTVIDSSVNQVSPNFCENISSPSQVGDGKNTASSQFNRPLKKNSAKMGVSPKSYVVSEKMIESAAKLGVPVFVKLKDSDPMLSNFMLTIKSTKNKKSREMVLLEGRRLIQDSIDAGIVPLIFFSRVDDIRLLRLPAGGVELYKVPYKTLSLWSDLSTSPGIMGIVKLSAVHEVKPSRESLPFTVICDNIRDPGNLGSVLRTAAGVGCQKVILTKGCVDVWDTKVLRGATGAHFRIPIHNNATWDSMDDLLGQDYSIYLADNNVGEKSFHSNHNNMIIESENEQSSCGDVLKRGVQVSDSEKSVIKEMPALCEIPICPYHDVNFTSKSSVVLVIGGETEGLSVNAFRLAHKKQGARLIVPLSNNIESLNTSTALGVISFEIKRQMSQHGQCKVQNK